MGIPVEFCPDLALRKHSEFEKGDRKEAECIPRQMTEGQTYDFLKKGQRLYWFSDDPNWSKGELPLCTTTGNANLSRPIASIKIIEATHFLAAGEIWTKGKYTIIETFDVDDPKINFEACKRIKR